MVSAGTLHVVSTELAVGSFAMAGAAFVLAGAASQGLFGLRKYLAIADHVAHFAMVFGLLALPMAILTGVQASPGEGVDHPLLINKMLLASAAFGLSFGVLLARRNRGKEIWFDHWSRRWQMIGGMGATGLILTTASIGGTYARGESLLDMLHLPYDTVPLMPMWLSAMVILYASWNLFVLRKKQLL